MSTEQDRSSGLRRIQVIFKVTEAERDQLRAGAKRAGQRYSTWARAVLLREADSQGAQDQRGESTQDSGSAAQAPSVPVPEVRPE